MPCKIRMMVTKVLMMMITKTITVMIMIMVTKAITVMITMMDLRINKNMLCSAFGDPECDSPFELIK